tara:strand:+ start:2209 stop:3111 length:903 start_codon:yes stop_codon:yes gene_type:complete
MMIKLQDIINILAPKKIIGRTDIEINNICALDEIKNSNRNSLFWLNDKNCHRLSEIKTGVIICKETKEPNNDCTYIIVKEPRRAFALVITNFFSQKNQQKSTIEKSVIIDNGVQLGENVSIGHNSIIMRGSIIGDNTIIGSNNVIHENTIIGKNVKIGSNNTIGAVGFGYQQNEDGLYERIGHIGNVIIKDGVEISNNTCIDQAVLGSTVIGFNSKIDNLVHIAHGVKIGENSLIIANAMIAGSTIIGDNVWVAPSASVLNKLEIGDHSIIGMGSVVTKNIESKSVAVGNPAIIIRKRDF